MSEVYAKRGVSAGKEEVHAATKHLDRGLYPGAFCKILPDFAGGDPDYCSLMHADTAGTKTSLAYLYWRETGDLSVWDSVAEDAIVMNVDDMACVGLTTNIALSSTLGRNAHLIPGEVIARIVNATAAFAERMRRLFGIELLLAGGETADVGDIVRTIDVGITAYGRLRREHVVQLRPVPGDLIVGFSSAGQASYESTYNSGIGSNGLTGARHDLLHHDYAKRYPESFDPNTELTYVYQGANRVTDKLSVPGHGDIDLGKLLLSPTRSFLPLLHRSVKALGPELHGLVHNTGGAQSKATKFVRDLRLVKDRLLPLPPLFAYLAEQTPMSAQERYKVYNMGTRLEAYVPRHAADKLLTIAAELNIEAAVIGHIEEGVPGVSVTSHEGEHLWYPAA